jgi:Bardet-Biedl syndrome 2 protein
MQELKNYEDNLRTSKEGSDENTMIPKSTKIQCKLEPNEEKHQIDLVVQTNNSTTIRTVVVFAEQIFEEESFVL